MINKCWICEANDAETGEHVIMKSACERLMGKLKNGEKVFFSHIQGKKNIPIGSFKNDQLKFNKSICKTCNNVLTQPYDTEFLKFIDKIIESKSLIISRNRLSLTSLDQTKLALHFIKIFGCLLIDNRVNINSTDYERIRCSILEGKVLTNKINLSVHRHLGKLALMSTPTIANYPVFSKNFCVWIIDLDWISLVVSYPFAPMQKEYGTQWQLNTTIQSMKLGKLK
jgi:hypothetical protein